MMKLLELVRWLDSYLLPGAEIKDASNNGLQVEGNPDVARVAFGVDASRQFFEAALAEEADLLVVHHGLSWGENLRRIQGYQAERMRILFENRLSLYASHLPLDMHPAVGNNTVLAARIGLSSTQPFAQYGGVNIGVYGDLDAPVSIETFARHLNETLMTETETLAAGPEHAARVGAVSGGGADAVSECAARGIDTLVTGEFSHEHVHPAKETGVNIIAAGHYRTEVLGVQALMDVMRERWNVYCEFVDLPTGY